VTFAVVNETFRIRLTTDEQLEAARAAQAGGTARIPVGRIVSGTQVNSGWSWHLEDLAFAETAIELCERPSFRCRTGWDRLWRRALLPVECEYRRHRD